VHDAIVIGVGTMGSAACSELARRGWNVLGLDQYDIPNALAAHHGRSRMFRTSYYEHADYVPLLRRALSGWKAIEERTGRCVFYPTGGLYIGPEDGALVRGSLDAARRHGLPHERLDKPELERRFPHLRVPAGFAGTFETDAGFIVPELAVEAMAGEAAAAGAALRTKERVIAWDAQNTGVEVRTDRGTYTAARLIITAGPWSGKLAGAAARVTITRQVVGWVSPRRPELFGLGRWPCWAIERPGGGLLYGFPMTEGEPGMKVALHAVGEVVDPDSLQRDARPEDEAGWREGLRAHFPDADGPTTAHAACMYDNSPDGHFIVDFCPGHANVVMACGFSGHGFKFAPVIGEALADLAMQGTSSLPIGFLGLTRFAPSGGPS
jgi:sarcosine oxidase